MAVKRLKDLKHLPGTDGLPYFGDLFPYLRNATKYYRDKQRKFGDVFRSTTPFATAVTLIGPAANKFILVEEAKFFSNQEAWEVALKHLFPNGLMLMDGEKHRHHRSIMNEAFKKKALQGYLDMMPDAISSEIQKIGGKKRLLMFPYVKEATLTIASKVFLGIQDDDDIPEVNRHISNLVNAALALPIPLPFTKHGKGKKSRAFLVEYFNKLIVEKRSRTDTDLLSRFCHATNEEGHGFKDEEIVDHMIFVLMAAHDTTASTLTTMSYYLAKYPEWQEKLYMEGQELLSIENPQIADLRNMTLTGLVIKESLRLHPPLISVARKAEKEYVIEGHRIPKDAVVQLVMQMTHLDGRTWTDPMRFDPLRFDNDRKEHMKCPFAYAPFGAGQHHCIGYAFAEIQMKLFISQLLSEYELALQPDYTVKMIDVPLKHPKDGLPLVITKRKSLTAEKPR